MEHKWLLEEKKDESPLSQRLELRWRVALREAAGLAGFVVLKFQVTSFNILCFQII
jgi:hypothetical protein